MMDAASAGLEKIFASARNGTNGIEVHCEASGVGFPLQPRQQILSACKRNAPGVLVAVDLSTGTNDFGPVGIDNLLCWVRQEREAITSGSKEGVGYWFGL